MKTLLCTAGLLSWIGLVLAAPAGDPAPPPTRPFLGVHVVAVPSEVRAQTTLEEGAGLLIDFVQPESPAAKAGFKLFDILTDIGDQKLLSSEQFTNLIRSSKTDHAIEIGILRQGKPLKLATTLTLVEERAMEMTPAVLGANGSELSAEALENRKTLLRLLNQLGQGSTKEAKLERAQHCHFSMSDPQGSVEIITKDGHQTAVVKGPDGGVLFEGLFHTDAERKAIKPEVLARIEQLEQSAKAVSQQAP